MDSSQSSPQVISVLGRPVVLAVSNDHRPCAGGNPAIVPKEYTPPRTPVKIYTNETLAQYIHILTRAILDGIPNPHLIILRDEMITKSFWSEDETPAIHIVFTTTVSDIWVVLANKLTVKYGIGSVIFVAYDPTESSRLHFEEVAVWVYATVCDHPASVKNLENMLRGMWDNLPGGCCGKI
jgi:hypothetical protein